MTPEERAIKNNVGHGINRYSNYRCRCAICKEARRVANQTYMRKDGKKEKRSEYLTNYMANPENAKKVKRYTVSWYQANKERVCSEKRKCYSDPDNKRKMRDSQLRTMYNISLSEYEKMLLSQGNRCACCGYSLGVVKKDTHIDHDHETGAVRGILCNSCNLALGMVKENILTLQNMIGYILGLNGENNDK